MNKQAPIDQNHSEESKQIKRHIICERDVGLFSLILQVIANIPWANHEGRTPIVFFNKRCAYWTPKGFRGKSNVWEYYFEPLHPDHSADTTPHDLLEKIQDNPPSEKYLGYFADPDTFVTNHFGDHPKSKRKALQIPYKWADPDISLRKKASEIIHQYIHPRAYILEQVDNFFNANLNGAFVIGLHIRGTDAGSKQERSPYRQGLLNLANYIREVKTCLDAHPDAKIFVATDSQASLEAIQSQFGTKVFAYDSIRHHSGEPAGQGPTGHIMPKYISEDRERAAQNGMEAVIEYLLLTKSDVLIHNGAGIARTVLLTCPNLMHVNTYRPNKLKAHILGFSIRRILTHIKRYVFGLLESDKPAR